MTGLDLITIPSVEAPLPREVFAGALSLATDLASVEMLVDCQDGALTGLLENAGFHPSSGDVTAWMDAAAAARGQQAR
ncbi:MAG: hypothetical protein GWP18_04005 [Proteobacteria bacterium]|nr:hypothetical protein [Pseudomonadota bacterium]